MPRLPGRDHRSPGPAGERPYQTEGVQFLEAGPRRFLADEPGLGKSLQLVRASRGDTLVVAPGMVLQGGTWDVEVGKWADDPSRFTQVSYTSLNTREKTGRGSGTKPSSQAKPEYDRAWGTVILDEAHYVKGRKTTWTQSLRKVCAKSERVYLASGTPIPNWPHELFVPLQLLNPGEAKPGRRFGSYWGWAEEWFRIAPDPHRPRSKVVRGLLACSGRCSSRAVTDPCEHLQEFVQANFGDDYLQRLRDDVLTDLPPLTGPVRVNVPFGPDQQRVYRELRDELVTDLPSGEELVAWSPGSKVALLDQLCTGIGMVGLDPLQPEDLKHSAKLERLKWDLTDRATPTLVVAHYRRSVEAAAMVARLTGAKASVVHGGTSPRDRRAAVEGFQAGRVDVLCGSLQTVSEGLTLTAADLVVFLETSYRPSTNTQATRRIHRLGQTRPCLALDYVATTARGGKTLDGLKRELLAEKSDLQARVLTAAQLLAAGL